MRRAGSGCIARSSLGERPAVAHLKAVLLLQHLSGPCGWGRLREVQCVSAIGIKLEATTGPRRRPPARRPGRRRARARGPERLDVDF